MQLPVAVFLQVILTCAAGYLLWVIWRRMAATDATAGSLIGMGIAIRAFAAQIVFWISYLHLPVGRSLQTGDGFWALAIDARLYWHAAEILLGSGWRSVVFINMTLPSPVFLQVLALFQLLFGPVASVGSLLNLFAYLGACYAILRIGRAKEGLSKPARIALAGISFAPSAILWSLQPLKDSLFVFLVAAFVAACAIWQERWLSGRTLGFLVPLFAFMFISLYAVVGIRWYFGLVLWLATLPFFFMTTLRSRRRVMAAAVGVVVFIALSRPVVLAGGPYLPPPVAKLLFMSKKDLLSPAKMNLPVYLEESRRSFDRVRGASMIQVGNLLQGVDGDGGDSAVATTSVPPPPRSASVTAPVATARVGSAPVATPPAVHPSVQAESRLALPQSKSVRLVVGLAAVMLPRLLAERCGLVHIGGGQGLWAIVEADTLVFDTILLLVLIYAMRGAGLGLLRNPSFWLVAVTTVTIAVLLSYTVSNFGTLFRHRTMIYMGLCLLLCVMRGAAPAKSAEGADVVGATV